VAKLIQQVYTGHRKAPTGVLDPKFSEVFSGGQYDN
jgi:hypothetical protein